MVDVTTLLAFLADGLAIGAVFALLGISITLVFGLGEVLNLTLGLFAVIAVVAVNEFNALGPLPIALLGGLVVVALLGLLLDQTVLSLVYRSEGEERILVGIFVTLGLALLMEGVLFLTYPASYSLTIDVPSVTVGGILIRGSSIVAVAVTAVLFAGLYLFLTRTYLGLATRTVIQDETGAVFCGIDPRRIQSFVFVLSLLIAAIAGFIYSLTNQVGASNAINLSIFAIIVSIVGGVKSVSGTVIAGLLLGIVTTLASAYIGAYVSQVVLFGVVVIALVIRPEQIT